MDPRPGGLPQHPKPAACCGPHTPKPRSRPRWRWLHHMPVVLATGEDAAEQPALACPLLLRGAALTRGCPLCSWILPAAFPSQAARESAASPGMWWLCPPHSHAAHGTGLSGGIWVPLSCPGTRARRLRRAGQVSAIPVAGIYFLSPCPTFRAVPCPFSGLALLLCFCRDRNSPRGAKIELRICKCCLCSPCCLLLFSRNDDFPANLSPARRFGIREC